MIHFRARWRLAAMGQLTWQSTFARFGHQILLSIYNLCLSGMWATTWGLKCTHIFNTTLNLAGPKHIGPWVHQIAHFGCILLVLDSLKLCSVRCSYVSCSSSGRSFGCIFDLSPCQWLWNLLVFALILNFDICSRRVTHRSIDSLLALIVVNFSDFLQSLLLTHIECLMRWPSDGGPLWMATRPSLSRSLSMSQKHDGTIRVISLPIVVHMGRLS